VATPKIFTIMLFGSGPKIKAHTYVFKPLLPSYVLEITPIVTSSQTKTVADGGIVLV
jgi:hypothetical protein